MVAALIHQGMSWQETVAIVGIALAIALAVAALARWG